MKATDEYIELILTKYDNKYCIFLNSTLVKSYIRLTNANMKFNELVIRYNLKVE